MKKIFLVIFALFSPFFLLAQIQLAQFSFTGAAGNEANFPPDAASIATGLTVSNISRSAAIGTGAGIAGRFNSNTWTTSTSVDLNRYFTFSIQAQAGFNVSLNRIELDEDRSATGIRNWQVRSSLDNFTTVLAVFSVPDDTNIRTAQTINLTGFINFTTAVEFRFYGYTSEATGGLWRLDNIKIFGTMTDTAPPFVSAVLGIPTQGLTVVFSEPVDLLSSQNTANYFISNGLGNPNSATRNPTFPNRVLLNFANHFVLGTNYQITTQNIKDLANNFLTINTLNFTFQDNAAPELTQIKVIASNALDVFFSEPLAISQAQNATNYSVSGTIGSPVSAIRDATQAHLVHLLFDKNFNENTNYTLTINNLQDLATVPNTIPTLTGTFQYDTRRPTLDQIMATSPNTLKLYFSEPLDPLTSQIINHYSVSSVFPTSAQLDPSNPAILTLSFSSPFQKNTTYGLRLTNIKDLNNNTITTTTRNFVYDPDSPIVLKVKILNTSELEIECNETLEQNSAQNLSFYQINNGIGNPISALFNTYFPNRVRLGFTTGTLNNNLLNTLTISQIQDLAQNQMLTANFTLDMRPPVLANFFPTSKRHLELYFSEPLNLPIAENAINYSVSGLGNPQFVSVENHFTSARIILTYSTDFQYNTNYTLQISNLQDQAGNTINPIAENFVLPNRILSVSIIGSNLAEIIFENEVSNEALITANYIINNTLGKPSAVVINPDSKNKVQLIFAQNFTPNTIYEIQIGKITFLNGLVSPQTVLPLSSDKQPPTVLSAKVISKTEIKLYFSKPLNEVTAEALNAYTADQGLGRPTNATYNRNELSVTLKFAQNFNVGTNYTLTVRNIQDDKSNTMLAPQNITFQRPAPPKTREILITEIFADPTPTVQLPEQEYIELYNNSSQTFNLAGLKLTDGSTTLTLPEFNFLPNSYLLLVANAHVPLFSKYGTVLGLSSTIALTNSGKELRLMDEDNNLIFRVLYSDTWYKDAKKKEGGWSLEMIGLNSTCPDADNWIASVDLKGGTPAKQNSVFGNNPDKTAPEIRQAVWLDNQTLSLQFTENTDSLTLLNRTNYQVLNENWTNSSLSLAEIKVRNLQSAELKWTNPIPQGVIYNLIINNLRYCAGNVGKDTLQFGIGKMPVANELIINEIMADEEPAVGLPLAEYLELYNSSEAVLDLGLVSLQDATSQIRLPSFLLRPKSYVLLTSTTKVSLFTKQFPDIQVLGVPNFPSLNNTGEPLTLRDTTGTVIFSLTYSDSWYGDAVKKNGGWSLERTENQSLCKGSLNWSASFDPKGGTPAKPNSLKSTNDQIRPRITTFAVLDEQNLRMVFSKEMDSSNFVAKENYVLPTSNIQEIRYLRNNEIQIVLSQKLENRFHSLQVRVRDCAGNSLDSLLSFGLGRSPKANELIISEIMADETPRVGLPLAEWIELHNRTSELIMLRGLAFEDNGASIALPDRLLRAGEYLVLCATSKADSLPNSVGIAFPSLTNSGETLRLRNLTTREVIFEVNYSDTWYQNSVKRNGGWTLELIDKDNFCLERENWTASVDPSGGTPARQNSVARILKDTLSPELLEWKITDSEIGKIQFIFSEKIDTLLAKNKEQYAVNQNLSIQNISILTPNSIEIWLGKIQENRLYELEIKNLSDCAGNMARNLKIQFAKGAKPEYEELLITEIMADPSPVVGLPDAEYLEIYNRSSKMIDLSEVQLVDENVTANLPSKIIFPKEYLLLCSSSKVADFQKLIPQNRIVALPNFPSLTNAGEKLSLLDKQGKILFSVRYSDTWYSSATKRQGGWSLEMIDLNVPCREAENWAESEHAQGGTPAAANSVLRKNPDNQAPTVESLQVLSDTLLKILFSEKMDTVSVLQAKYEIEGISLRGKFLENNREILLSVSRLSSAKIYSLNIENVKDCSANILEKIQISFGMGEKPKRHEMLITEFMPDPSPVLQLPENEYIELHNPTNKVLQLGECRISNGRTSAKLPFMPLYPQEYAILCPNSAVLAFQNQFPKAKIIGVSPWVSLDNEKGKLFLRNLDRENNLIFSLNYDQTWYKNKEKQDGGWSLEMRDLASPCVESSNWEASQSSQGGTPAARNSVSQKVQDTKPPVLLKAEAIDSLQVRLIFDEKLDSLDATKTNFRVSDNEVERIEIGGENWDRVFLKLKKPLEKKKRYMVFFQYLKDCAGNFAGSEVRKEFVLAEKVKANELVLNEVLFNQPVGGVDFVEIYNATDKFVNLQNWKLGNVEDGEIRNLKLITDEILIIEPQGYRVFTENIEQLKRQYSQGADSNFVKINDLPTYNDGEGTVVLMDDSGNYERLDYHKDWHFALIDDQNGVSLERINPEDPTNDRHNWHSAAAPQFGTPGYRNSQFLGKIQNTANCMEVENPLFTPDGDGFQDFMLLRLKCLPAGAVGNIRVFDLAGIEIKRLAQNQTLSTETAIRWDGTDESGQKARVGYYLVHIQWFALDGSSQTIQQKVVVGTKF